MPLNKVQTTALGASRRARTPYQGACSLASSGIPEQFSVSSGARSRAPQALLVNEIRGQKMAYTVEEAAEKLSLSRAHVYRLLDLGELGSISIGRSRRITANQLQEFLTALEQRSVVRPPTLGEILAKRKR